MLDAVGWCRREKIFAPSRGNLPPSLSRDSDVSRMQLMTASMGS